MAPEPFASVVAHLFPGAQLKAASRLDGGVSADVHRLDLSLTDGRARSLVLRAHGRSHAGHAAELEFQLLEALRRSGVPVPEPLLVDVSGSLLPEPFLVMALVEGDSQIPETREGQYIEAMADMLSRIHSLPTTGLPTLPTRDDPLPEVFDFLPEESEWGELRAHLRSITDSAYRGSPRLLHGDFWPENLIWRAGAIVAILDWEDAAFGDPMSDLAGSRLELRYRFGKAGMERLTRGYARHRPIDHERLALWQVYVAATALRFMGGWGLAPPLEAHMRQEALHSIREAGDALMDQAT